MNLLPPAQPWPLYPDVVRHTTKLLKSRDSRTGRLIINQYMKGKEIGRGVHGIVYIGKNMDQVVRTSTSSSLHNSVSTNASSLLEPLECVRPAVLPSECSGSPPFAPSHPSQSPNGVPNDSDGQGLSYLSDQDYETVAIKVVRREPRGPKSLRRSQMQRQREREDQEAPLPLRSPFGSRRGPSDWEQGGFLSPDPSAGRVPLLKDVDDKLKKEIAIMKRLRHRHIVQLKEVIDDAKSKKVFMILEFMEGGQVLWQDPLYQTPLMTVEQARKTFRQVLLGLEYLHYQGIIHRDIKPANLLWTADRETVKISDFGVSHISGVLKRSASTSNLVANLAPDISPTDGGPRTTNSLDDKALRKTEGSPAFMAPELCCPIEATPAATPSERKALDYFTTHPSFAPCDAIGHTTFRSLKGSADSAAHSYRLISLPLHPSTYSKGERPAVGKAIDIWALGVTLFCLLFGRTPFNAPNEYELFNVIWNESILLPDTMGIERQPINFDPGSRASDTPVERDSRELVDLLRGLLQKDPRKRIQLHEVKTHPWVLNNMDNTQHWVNETTPVGCDAVTVTTEEVANFSRPRASVTAHKPLSSVKQSLRKAAIKLGLQRSGGAKLTRFRTKSGSSLSASACTSPKISSPTLSLPPHSANLPAARKSPSASILLGCQQRASLFGSNLRSPERSVSPLTMDTSPICGSPVHTSPSNTHSTFRRSLGVCHGWACASASQLSPAVASSSVTLPIFPSPQATVPTISMLHADGHVTADCRPPRSTPLSLSRSLLFGSLRSPPSRDDSARMSCSPTTSPRNSIALSQAFKHSMPPGLQHIPAQPAPMSQYDRLQQRRSMPAASAPLHALVNVSSSSTALPGQDFPIDVGELGYMKIGPTTRFRDALFRVKKRFSRSHSRVSSQVTPYNDELSPDVDLSHLPAGTAVSNEAPRQGRFLNQRFSMSGITANEGGRQQSQRGGAVARRFLEGLNNALPRQPPSEDFTSDTDPSPQLRGRPDREVGCEIDEDEEDEEYSTSGHEEEEQDGPIMYHDGTKWSFSDCRQLSSLHLRGSESDDGRADRAGVDARPLEPAGESTVHTRGPLELMTPKPPTSPAECLSEEVNRLRRGVTMLRDAFTESGERPRLMISTSSANNGGREYRSSEEDDDDDDDNDNDGAQQLSLAGTSLQRRGSFEDLRLGREVGCCRSGSGESEDEEGNCTLQIQVKRGRRATSRSDGCG